MVIRVEKPMVVSKKNPDYHVYCIGFTGSQEVNSISTMMNNRGFFVKIGNFIVITFGGLLEAAYDEFHHFVLWVNAR